MNDLPAAHGWGCGQNCLRFKERSFVIFVFFVADRCALCGYQQIPSYCARTLLKSSGMRTRSTTI